MKALSILLMTLSLALVAAPAAHAGEEGLEDDNNAKLARIKAKQRRMGATSFGDSDGGGGGECGSLNVGNVQNNGRGRGPREVVVVVTGDIINANNKCGR